jgi:hypothetical protein
MRRFSQILALLLTLAATAASAEVRTWMDSTGKFSVRAELVEQQAGPRSS